MKIYSIHYNRPEYIQLQSHTLRSHMKIEYTFTIVDNSIDYTTKSKIMEETQRLGLGYINCNNNIRYMSSESHQNSFKYILSDVSEGDVFMIIDHDIFLIGDLTEDYYTTHDMVFLEQWRGKVSYPWPGMIIFNGLTDKDMISFNSGVVEGESCDTGGSMYEYIKSRTQKHVREKYINQGNLLSATLDGIFLHLISGSGWNDNYDLVGKLRILSEKINQLQ